MWWKHGRPLRRHDEGYAVSYRPGGIAGIDLGRGEARYPILHSVPWFAQPETAQRIRLASQLGSNLQGVCYILDEPTVGLGLSELARLVDVLDELVEAGGSVLVVEHLEQPALGRAQVVVGVQEVVRVLKPYKLVSRDFQPEDTVVAVGGDGTLSASYLTTLSSEEKTQWV